MKKSAIFIIFLLSTVNISGCDWSQERPILTVPDGNKDRIRKKILSGLKGKPKYWAQKVTVVETNFDTEPLGLFDGVETGTANIGFFQFTRDKLLFVDIDGRQFVESPEIAGEAAPQAINEWDIEHSEYRLKEIDGYTTNQEEENKYIAWDKKRFVIVDWSKSPFPPFPFHANSSRNKKCWKQKSAKTLDDSRETTEDYISFIISATYELKPNCAELRKIVGGDFTGSVHYKYSFKRIPNPLLKDKNYTPYVYDGEDDPLFRKYGYFTVVREAIGAHRKDKRIFYMRRWNPNKKHTFHFSKSYPEKYKYLAHGVICHTNKLFAKHKLNNYPLDGRCKEDGTRLPEEGETCTQGICFELKDNTGQELGDIRHSFFHLVEEDVGPLGYGPTSSNPVTGEILSGNVTIYTRNLDWFLRYDVGELIQRDSDKFEKSPLFVNMRQTLKEKTRDPKKWIDTAKGVDKIREEFGFLLSRLTFALPDAASFAFDSSLDLYSRKGINGGGKSQEGAESDIEEYFSNRYSLPIKKANEDLHNFFDFHYSDDFHNPTFKNSHVTYPTEPVLAQAFKMLAKGMSPEEAKKRILFNLMTHEFGHVLNLRHNFYGSVDSKHFHRDKEGRPVLKSSSVMDYLYMKDEAQGPPRALFGPYDEAALAYAYSVHNNYFKEATGEDYKDLSEENETLYLFCSNEHVPLNFLCNMWDSGSSPSEVMMNLIESYEERYFLINFRLDRAYWSPDSYSDYVIENMHQIKQALPLWQKFQKGVVFRALREDSTKSYTEEELSAIAHYLEADTERAVKLSLAFFSSVLKLDGSQRDWRDVYDESDSSLEKIGIFWDKLYSLLFLLGNTRIPYNPNVRLYSSSYITHIDQLPFRQMAEEILEDILTFSSTEAPRVFPEFSRFLYAQSSTDDDNLREGGGHFLEKTAVRCYTAKGLKERFGLNPFEIKDSKDDLVYMKGGHLDVAILDMESRLEKINDSNYHNTNEKLGLVLYNGNYYLASSHRNKFAFAIVEKIMEALDSSSVRDIDLLKKDFYEMYVLYHTFANQQIFTSQTHLTCQDGD